MASAGTVGDRETNEEDLVNGEETTRQRNFDTELIRIKGRKRTAKTKLTKLKHQLEKLSAKKAQTEEIEETIEEVWTALEDTLEVIQEISLIYAEVGDRAAQKEASTESETLEKEIQIAIEEGQTVIKNRASNETVRNASQDQNDAQSHSSSPPQPSSQETENPVRQDNRNEEDSPINRNEENSRINRTEENSRIYRNEENSRMYRTEEEMYSQYSPVYRNRENGNREVRYDNRSQEDVSHDNRNRYLKPLKVPMFDGDKRKFEDFWALFISLVDESSEPASLKMARLRQSLTGGALEAIRGLGVSAPEYEEAKEILLTKFGGARRQLRAYMDQLETFPPVRINDVQALEKFADLVRITVVKLQAENRVGELGDGTLHSMLVKKLPDRQLERYSRWLSERVQERSVINFRDWLKEEVRFKVEAAEMTNGIDAKPFLRNPRVSHPDFKPPRNFHVFTAPVPEEPKRAKPPCSLCGGTDHGIWFCKQFFNKNVDDRWQIAKEKRLCFRCLGSDHRGKECHKSQKCGINGCSQVHHRLLHGSEANENRRMVAHASITRETETDPVRSREGVPNRAVTMTCNSETLDETYSLRTVPVWIKANGKKVKINAILDDASNESFLNEEVAGILGLQEPFQKVQVHVLNNSVETFESMPLTLEVESVDGNLVKEIDVKTCPRNVIGGYRVVNWEDHRNKWPHLEQCNFPKPAKDGLVDLLIGIDNADLHFSHVDVQGQGGGPIARLGPLGWSCIGAPARETEAPQGRSHVIRALFSREPLLSDGVNPCCELDQTLKRFWEIESCGTGTTEVKVYSEEERIALKKVQNSLHYADGRYRIAVPWKEEEKHLPDNRQMAVSRLCSTERNLKKNEYVDKEYQKTIEAYLNKGYLRKVPPDEPPPPTVWYLPHFPVVRMDKSTTKVRIVFDCSAKCHGVSLNDIIHAGPKLQQDLFNVLVRFRRKPVAIACDIKEMYLQIEIEEKDRPFFRLLWRDQETEREPDTYEFTRVIFGKNSAPMESQFVAQENARRNRNSFPLAAETVLKSTYMDDSIDSVENDEEGVELYHQLKSLWGVANMQARKWISNSPKVIEVIPTEERATEIVLNDGQNPITKTLGISWNSTEDVFAIAVSPIPPGFQITKRNVLRKVATIFDPLGLVSPFVVVAKMLLQELWTRGYGWDDDVQDEIANRIENWFEQLPSLNKVKIPRCLRNTDPVKSQQIVTFVDASQQAYGSVVYLRCQYEDGTVTSRLIASKSKVAPLTPMTIPRLELMGAILGLRLTQSLLTALEAPMQSVQFYSDSTDVLWWIRGRGKDFRPFVANRIGEIQMFTEPSKWQHVRTDENPADLCTRGATPTELAECPLWRSGPTWLTKDMSEWPKMELLNRPVEMSEKKTSKTYDQVIACTTLTSKPQPKTGLEQNGVPNDTEWRLDPTRFSSWLNLVRIHARVRRVVYNMRSEEERKVGLELLPEELKEAEEEIVRSAQREAFRDEHVALSSGKQVPRKSPLTKLSPKLDDNGCIRLDGRLRFADFLPYDVRYPLILPRDHWVTKLIVKHYDEESHHSAGTNFILSQISQRFWIVAAREEIRAWKSECNMCKRKTNKTANQIMAPLHRARLAVSLRPFAKTAVDFAGPFITVQGRGLRRKKRWLCLFTCLTTRAVHLEVAWGLDTDSFLNAFTRFTSKRGVPEEVFSDCGTNFVGAARELKELVSQLDKDKVQRSAACQSIKWNFNPPGAPHFGGAHEVMIKAAKRAIFAVLSSSNVTDEELITVCAGAESLLNSRPLTYQTADPRDDVPLTPNHFLHGQLGGQFAPETVDITAYNLRRRWRKVQELISRVWTRWIREYLPMMNTRPKWTVVVENMKEGDVVLALQPNLPRGHWPLGRIVETYPGKDGHTRVAKVQCGAKTIVRPIHKLVPLNTEENVNS